MSTFMKIIQDHLDRTGAREAEFARRIGATPQTVNAWRKRGLRQLPEKRFLEAISDLTNVPYEEVLTAALRDIGYLTNQNGPRRRKPGAWELAADDMVTLSFEADDVASSIRNAEFYVNTDFHTDEDDPGEMREALEELVDVAQTLADSAQSIAGVGVGGVPRLNKLKIEARKAAQQRRDRYRALANEHRTRTRAALNDELRTTTYAPLSEPGEIADAQAQADRIAAEDE